jgi:hypothetical protein
MELRPLSAEYIAEKLRNSALCVTSWQELGVPYDEEISELVLQTATQSLLRRPQEEGALREVARGASEDCRATARLLAEPIVERLFGGALYVKARQDWFLFGVNYYEQGDVFPVHRDLNNPDLTTVVIMSLSGVRMLRVEGNPPVRLTKGSIALLDGGANPEHTAWCVEGPSVSVVVDVPALLR